MARKWLIAAVVSFAIGAQPIPMANASFPGSNGRIAFTSARDGEQRVWAMNTDGTMVRPITESIHLFTPIRPRWSPDGSKIVMSDNTGDGHLWIADVATGGVTDLGHSGHNPAWSPDGQRIAFDFNALICLMDADGSDRTCLTGDTYDLHPSWSPDGSRLALSRVIGGYLHIVTMKPDGTDVVQVTSGEFTDDSPDWSPDGSRIVFTRLAADGHPDIWTVRIDGSALTNLTPDDGWDANPDWSPDGSRIVFNSYSEYGLFVMDADGSDLHQIPGSEYELLFEPDWSSVPDLPLVQEPTELTLQITHQGRYVKVEGALEPLDVGALLTVTLYRRNDGRFERDARHKTSTLSRGVYFDSFFEPDPGTCKVVVKFRGDVDSLPTQTFKKFRCTD